MAPAFAGGISKSIVVSAAKEWLSQAVSVPSAGSPARPTDLAVEGLSRATLVLRESDVPASGCVRVSDCHECIVYVLAPMAFASVVNCADVTLVLGAVGRIMRLESCERCTIMAAARLLHLRNCHDCSLFVAVNMPPVLLGENRSSAAPYNTYYERLSIHLQAAGVSLAPNCWDQTVSLTPAAAASGGQPGRQGLVALPPEKCVTPLCFFVPFRSRWACALRTWVCSRPAVPLFPALLRSSAPACLRRFAPFIVPFRDGPVDDARDESANLTHANPFQMPQARAHAGEWGGNPW